MLNPQLLNGKPLSNLTDAELRRELLGVSAFSLGAEALREMWGEFKRKYLAASYDDIAEKFKNIPDANSRETALKKARAYSKFFDTVTESMASGKNVDVGHVSWLVQLSNKIDGAADASKKQNIDALVYLKEKVQTVLKPALKKIGDSTFDAAINRRVAHDLPSITDTVNRMRAAIEVNAICTSAKLGEDEATLHEDRRGHLREKWGVVKYAVEKGVLLGNETLGNAQPALQYIIDSMDAMGAQLFPIASKIALTIEREATLPEKLRDTAQYKSLYEPEIHANSMLYDAWNRSFERGAASLDPESIIGKIQEFHTALMARNGRFQPNIDAAPILLAEKLHDRIVEAMALPGNNPDTFLALSKNKESTIDFIIDHAPVAAMQAGLHLKFSQGISGNYWQIMKSANMVRDAAKITTIASQFAPEFDTGSAETFINEHYTKMLGQFIEPVLIDLDGSWEVASLEMGIASEALKKMSDVYNDRDKRIAENRKNPTMSYARIQREWEKTSIYSVDAISADQAFRAYDVFNETFSVYTTQHEASSMTIELAGLMHGRLDYALTKQAPSAETADRIRTLMEKTQTYLADKAPKVAAAALADLGKAALLDSHSDLLQAATRIRVAALAQTLAGQFAPNAAVDNQNEERIGIHFSKLQAGFALGPSVVNGVTSPESAMLAMADASGRVKDMQAARAAYLRIDSPVMNAFTA